jgi:hypothetical protein
MQPERKEEKPQEVRETNCPACGQHLVPNDVHGHIACFACGQTIEGCCGDGIG